MISCQNQGKTDMHTQKAFDRQTVLADTGERERTTNANIPYHLVQYQTMGNGYGRQSFGTGNLCCDLWCLDTMCECMGGDLCSCM